MSGEINSGPQIREQESQDAKEVILKGCQDCGNDATILIYSNEGYGDCWWHGYCRAHRPKNL